MAYISEEWCEICGVKTSNLNRGCRGCADRIHREKIAI